MIMQPAMKTILAAVAATTFAGVSSAQTIDARRDFDVIATVPGGCTVSEPSQSAGAQMNFRGVGGNTLQIDQLTDPTTLSTRAASIELSFEAMCHSPHRLIIESQNNGLFPRSERPAVPPAGFGTAVPYVASARWGTHNLRLEANAQSRQIRDSWVTSEPNTGSILLRLQIEPGATNRRQNAPLLAGVYADTLRITLEPKQ